MVVAKIFHIRDMKLANPALERAMPKEQSLRNAPNVREVVSSIAQEGQFIIRLLVALVVAQVALM